MTGEGHAVVTIDDDGDDCVRASSPNQDDGGRGCYDDGDCCGTGGCCGGTGCGGDGCSVVAASSWNVALLVLLSSVCNLGFAAPLNCGFLISLFHISYIRIIRM